MLPTVEENSEESDRFEYDFAKLQNDLIVRHSTDPKELPWLSMSREQPDQFWKALFTAFDGRSAVSKKSDYKSHVDFYHDLIVRNLGEGLVAYSEYNQATGAWSGISFDELHARSSALAAEWTRRDVEPEQTVAILLPVNTGYLVSLLTAFRLGLVVSVISPDGKDFVRKRLEILEPDFYVCESRVARDLSDLEIPVLPSFAEPSRKADRLLRSHSYEWDSVCAKLFSLWGPERMEPVELTGGELFSSLLTDALLVLNLRPKERMMAPGYDQQQHMPVFPMQTLLAGACWLEITSSQLSGRLELLKEAAPHVVGVLPALRDSLLDIAKANLPECRVWFRDPLLPFDWNSWDDFSKHVENPGTTTMNLAVNSAAGGSILFSRRYEANCGLAALPKPGLSWTLLDVNQSGQPAQGTTGIYAIDGLADCEFKYGTCVVSHADHGFMVTGSALPTLFGQTYPEKEIAELVISHPRVKHATFLTQSLSTNLNTSRANLLIFIEPRSLPDLPQFEARLRSDIMGNILLGYGQRFLPARVELFALAPRRTDEGDIDEMWIKDQYLSGFLEQKREIPIFNLIGQLHSIAQNPK